MARPADFMTTTHLVAHCLREVESSLRAVLATITQKQRTAKRTQGDNGHRQTIRDVLESLGIPEDDPIATAWLKLAGRENGYALHRRAHRWSLGPPRAVDNGFRDFWADMTAILDVVLGLLEVRYATIGVTIDALAGKAVPNDFDIDQLKNHIPHNFVSRQRFFGQLNHLGWIEPLRQAGFFSDPPTLEAMPDGTMAIWPESAYLARMASLRPTEVLAILQSITPTDNPLLHRDIADALVTMPAEISVGGVAMELDWIQRQTVLDLLLPERLGRLVDAWIAAGEIQPALRLAQEVLRPLPPRSDDRDQAIARCDNYDYEELLKLRVPALRAAAPKETLVILCELLDESIALTVSRTTAPADDSFLWRRAISSEPRFPEGPRDYLVSAVRDAATGSAEPAAEGLTQALAVLSRFNWHIFIRLRLHVLATVSNTPLESAIEPVWDPELLAAHWCRPRAT